jgi:MSHA pilin protein MshD
MMNERGFTLIELVMTIVVLGIAVSGLMVYFIQGVGTSHQSQQRVVALTLAQDLMEEIDSKCWDNTAASSSPCAGTVTPSTIGPDSGEGRSTYDDVDDFNGMNNTPPKSSQGAGMTHFTGYTQKATVCYVASGTLNTCKGSGTSDYKKIVVDILYGAGNTIELVTLAVNH